MHDPHDAFERHDRGLISRRALVQLLGVAAQRAIADMRKKVQARIMQLPVSFFDATQTGVLVSRVMTDAEGIRNLVGTGLVQLTGSILTAVLALGVLLYLNWTLTLVTIVVLGTFGGGMAMAFRRLRPLFRERGQINAEVTGRLTEALGGIRVVKSYTAEKREEIVFTKGAHRLFRNIASLDVEEAIRGLPIDGVVLLVGCDKTTPALLMGAASCDIPTIALSGGPMLNGKYDTMIDRETSQKPMFELLGAADKQWKSYETDHIPPSTV